VLSYVFLFLPYFAEQAFEFFVLPARVQFSKQQEKKLANFQASLAQEVLPH
jgi:hypothetical protein